MDKKLEAQVRDFKRLDLALVSFREARALTEHVLKLGIYPASDDAALYSACCSGIVTTYTRPFMRADGLGSLDSKYERFSDDRVADTHRGIFDCRNLVFAHRDLTQMGELVLSKDSHPVPYESIIEIGVNENGTASIGSVPALLYLPEKLLPDILTLCDFQLSRIGKDAVALLENMAGSKAYRPGSYTVGLDFP